MLSNSTCVGALGATAGGVCTFDTACVGTLGATAAVSCTATCVGALVMTTGVMCNSADGMIGLLVAILIIAAFGPRRRLVARSCWNVGTDAGIIAEIDQAYEGLDNAVPSDEFSPP